MSRTEWNRRRFLHTAVGAAGVGLVASRRLMAQGASTRPDNRLRPVRLGGPVFDAGNDPEAMARAHRKLGYRAAYCPEVSLHDTARIRAVEDAFAKHDVVIAEVGRWCNLLDADPEKRKANRKVVAEGLALADAVGALCCVDIAGSYSAESWFGPHPDNFSQRFFEETVENARAIIDAVKPKRAKFCLEMLGWAMPDSPETYLRLIRAVDRKAFGAHVDLCNLVNSPKRFYRNADLCNEIFDTLGPHIVSCHAKDLVWDVEMNIHFREVPAGSGKMDYATYIRRVASLPHDAPLMIEHCANAEEYDRARRFILDAGAKIGVRFG